MSTIKTYKKGDYLFREGDKAAALYLIQSGAVSVCLLRGKKIVELFALSSQSVVGDQALQGSPTHAVSAVCTTDVKAIEIPVDLFRTQSGAAQQAVQLVLKSLTERMKTLVGEVKSARLERDSTPVPEDQIARALGVAFHAATYRGKKDGDGWLVNWLAYRQYAQRVFGESPKRLEQMASIFAKLKMASLVMGKDETAPELPESLQAVRFVNLPAVEAAADFYQHWYFKGGRADLLKVEEGPMALVNALIKCCDGEPVDRRGVTILDYGKLLDRMKTEFEIAVKPDHWNRLEQKGLFARLKQTDAGVQLHVEIAEFRRVRDTWRILREIDRLNERGYVDMLEEADGARKKGGSGEDCPSCNSTFAAGQKFCANCGAKLGVAA